MNQRENNDAKQNYFTFPYQTRLFFPRYPTLLYKIKLRNTLGNFFCETIAPQHPLKCAFARIINGGKLSLIQYFITKLLFFHADIEKHTQISNCQYNYIVTVDYFLLLILSLFIPAYVYAKLVEYLYYSIVIFLRLYFLSLNKLLVYAIMMLV